jgi:hypothetical protein
MTEQDSKFPDPHPGQNWCDHPPLPARIQRIVLYLNLEAPKRPLVSLAHGGTLTRPADWCPFGVEGWHTEIDRRKKIHTLMTDDERKVFDQYCTVRDE